MDEKKEPTLLQQRKKDLFFSPTNGYDRLAPGEEEDIQAYCAGYKTFLDEGKTERECVDYPSAWAGSPRVPPPGPGGRNSGPWGPRCTGTTGASPSCWR